MHQVTKNQSRVTVGVLVVWNLVSLSKGDKYLHFLLLIFLFLNNVFENNKMLLHHCLGFGVTASHLSSAVWMMVSVVYVGCCQLDTAA